MARFLGRRQFLKAAAGATATAASARSLSAASYARVKGANERIAIGIIGCGGRGSGAHMPGIHKHQAAMNFEITALSDPYRIAREKANGLVKEWHGREARAFVSHRDVIALKDVDAVMISSPDHLHARQLEEAARAGKHIYIEKPIARNMEELVRSVDAVKEANVIVQVGTQLRSEASYTGCRKLYATGILGTVGRVEQCRNGAQPFWVKRLADVKREDLDWAEFNGGATDRPFDPMLFSAWYGYREFCDGLVPQWGSHFIDTVHYITGATFPTSCVCHGGTFTYVEEAKFTVDDHVQCLWVYPPAPGQKGHGFMVSYSTNFGNSSGNSWKIYGDKGLLDMTLGNSPVLSADGGANRDGSIR
ncbi:MAG: Gfo/Idh/MocA family oxidoreductase, partial [Verrucomicrobiae bacterium]|nr:Gfo/Idh/MocA family oxidoreductase [Verrucomicrobiae bacterium]